MSILNQVVHKIYYTKSFLYNDTAPTVIYTLSLHDALPIFVQAGAVIDVDEVQSDRMLADADLARTGDRKSTRLNSSHGYISYAVFCLKKKISTLRPHLR